VSLGFRPIACARRSDDTDASLGEGYRDALPLQAAKSARDSPDLAHPSNAGRQSPEGGMMSGAGPPAQPQGEAGRRTDRAELSRDARGRDRSEKTRNLL
jgi:hypothetical protein